MNDVVCTLKKQVEEKIEANKQKQKANVLEREQILGQMEGFHDEVRARERETQVCASLVITKTLTNVML